MLKADQNALVISANYLIRNPLIQLEEVANET